MAETAEARASKLAERDGKCMAAYAHMEEGQAWQHRRTQELMYLPFSAWFTIAEVSSMRHIVQWSFPHGVQGKVVSPPSHAALHLVLHAPLHLAIAQQSPIFLLATMRYDAL